MSFFRARLLPVAFLTLGTPVAPVDLEANALSSAPSSAPSSSDGNRIHLARYEIQGPLEWIVFGGTTASDARASAGSTRVALELRPGESRTLDVPLGERAPGGPPEATLLRPETSPDPDGALARVEPLGFVDPGAGDAQWRRLPPGLRARSGPPVEGPVGSLRALDLAWLLACSGLVFGLRRRPSWACALGLVGAAGALALRRGFPPPAPMGLTVIEADVTSGHTIRVDAASGTMRLPEGLLPFWVTTRPPDTEVHWDVDWPRGGEMRLACEVSGAVRAVSACEGGPLDRMTSAANDWRPLAEVWFRSSHGEWSVHGPWPTGSGLSPALESGGMPPGWLASGIPPGRGVLIARLATAEGLGSGLEPLGPGAPVWLRATGFE